MADHQGTRTVIRRRVFRGAASNTLGQVAALLILFALTPVILDRVGVSGYGLWALVGSIAAYGALLDLGIGSAIVKYTAEFRARADTASGTGLIATALRVYLVLGAIAVVCGVVLAPIIPVLINIRPADRPTASLLVLMTGLNVGISIASAPATSVLLGLQRFDLYNVVSTGGTVLWAIGTVLILQAGGGVVGMVALNIPVTLAMRFVCIEFIRRTAPDLPFGYAGASRAVARRVLGYSWSIFASDISTLLQKKSDELVIGTFLSVAAVTPYSLARRLSEVAHVLTNQFVRVLLPLASELDAGEDRSRLIELYLVSTRLTVAIFASIGLGLVVLAGQVMLVWVGPGYDEAIPIVAILTTASLLLTSQWPAGSILQGMARFQPVAVTSVVSGLVNLALSIILVGRLGIVGVAWGTFVPTAVETIGFVLPYTMWVLRVSPWRALRETWLPALAPAVPAGLVLLLLREVVAPQSLIAVGLTGACGTATYAIAYLALPATSIERLVLLEAGRDAISMLARLRVRYLAPSGRRHDR